ncbi:MAG: hypothetical protein R2752_13865 [Vicinamibacterales bacterium]
MTLKSVGWIALAVTVAFGIGWMIGGSGRAALVQEQRALEERAGFAEARALVLQGRVDLFTVNFGNASARFEEARAKVEQLQAALREVGLAERAGRLEIVLAQLRDAQRLASSLDQAAQSAATQALDALDAAR